MCSKHDLAESCPKCHPSTRAKGVCRMDNGVRAPTSGYSFPISPKQQFTQTSMLVHAVSDSELLTSSVHGVGLSAAESVKYG